MLLPKYSMSWVLATALTGMQMHRVRRYGDGLTGMMALPNKCSVAAEVRGVEPDLVRAARASADERADR